MWSRSIVLGDAALGSSSTPASLTDVVPGMLTTGDCSRSTGRGLPLDDSSVDSCCRMDDRSALPWGSDSTALGSFVGATDVLRGSATATLPLPGPTMWLHGSTSATRFSDNAIADVPYVLLFARGGEGGDLT